MSATTKRTPRRAAAAPRSGPSEVAPGIFVGGWNDALGFSGSRFCVLDEAPEGMPEGTHIPIYDEAKDAPIRANLDRLAREIGAARRAGRPVLVFCGHGVRRSPLGAAWYLHRSEAIELDAAYDRIRAVRPKVEPARAWIGDLEPLERP
ncbi:MAG TPA: dual specificity protein phosphatase family protein [Thermoplasmata archaeon]|nr:dual specificity protein phosphatase family protein [Thermoplasmata archaeon]